MADESAGAIPTPLFVEMTQTMAKAMTATAIHEAAVDTKLATVISNQDKISKHQELVEAKWLIFTRWPTVSAFVIGIALGLAIAAFGVPALMRAGLEPAELLPVEVGQ